MSRNDHGDDLSNKCSRGVHTSDQYFVPSSDSELIESVKCVKESISQDADRSSASSEIAMNHVFSGQSHKLTSDTDAEYYKMKTLTRKGLKTRPCKIEFQLVKQSVKQNISKLNHNSLRQSAQSSYIRHKCRCDMEKQNYKEDQTKVGIEENIAPPRAAGNIMSWLRKPPKVLKMNSNVLQDESSKVKIRDLENAEVYYFDHGSPTFYQTTDCPPHLVSEILAQRTTYHSTRFWAEFFGTLNIGVTFVVTFLLQFYRFILYSMLRAIIVGFLQITSDYFIKPLLAVLFNGLCQPPFIFIRNVLQSICKMLDPVAKLLTTFLRPIADLVRAFRVVEVKNINRLWQEPKGSQKLKVLQEQGSV